MRKMLICSKKSVRTLKFLIEPYFLSHAERGKPFWILDSAGIQPQCRAFGATAFLARIRILNFGGQASMRLAPFIAIATQGSYKLFSWYVRSLSRWRTILSGTRHSLAKLTRQWFG